MHTTVCVCVRVCLRIALGVGSLSMWDLGSKGFTASSLYPLYHLADSTRDLCNCPDLYFPRASPLLSSGWCCAEQGAMNEYTRIYPRKTFLALGPIHTFSQSPGHQQWMPRENATNALPSPLIEDMRAHRPSDHPELTHSNT